MFRFLAHSLCYQLNSFRVVIASFRYSFDAHTHNAIFSAASQVVGWISTYSMLSQLYENFVYVKWSKKVFAATETVKLQMLKNTWREI
jgi:hypothetical protein